MAELIILMGRKTLTFLSLSTVILVLIVSSIRLVGCTSDITEPDFIIMGTVRDALTGQTIAGAEVSDSGYGPEPRKGAITGSDGKYSYATWYEEHTIVAKAPGYKTQSQTLMTKFLGKEEEKIMDFALMPE